MLLPASVLIAGCNVREAYEQAFALGFPEPISVQGQRIYDLWLGSAAAAAAVGVFVWALMLWAGFRYRRKSDELPRQVRYNLPIEVLYTVVPFVVIAVLFYYTTISQNFVNKLSDESEGGADVNIGVVGFQWNWTFNYVDEGVSVTGFQTAPAVLYLPTDRTIRFRETSPDVIHSFWVPQFLFKRDVVPGRENTFELTLTKEGEYIGRCAEFCGEKHSAMNFYVRVVSPQAYDAYIAELQADPANRIGSGINTGAVRGAASSGSDS
ncbi:MAG: cytochrome c oxidase subunit II [Mycobacteriales bacterium]